MLSTDSQNSPKCTYVAEPASSDDLVELGPGLPDTATVPGDPYSELPERRHKALKRGPPLSTEVIMMDADVQTDGPATLAETFEWPSHGFSRLSSEQRARLALNMQRMRVSTHCSGMGCFEIILDMVRDFLVAAGHMAPAPADAACGMCTHVCDVEASRQLVLMNLRESCRWPGLSVSVVAVKTRSDGKRRVAHLVRQRSNGSNA
jgi:hypothetical protein